MAWTERAFQKDGSGKLSSSKKIKTSALKGGGKRKGKSESKNKKEERRKRRGKGSTAKNKRTS